MQTERPAAFSRMLALEVSKENSIHAEHAELVKGSKNRGTQLALNARLCCQF